MRGDKVRIDGEPQNPQPNIQFVLPNRLVPVRWASFEQFTTPDVVCEYVDMPVLLLDLRGQTLDLSGIEMVDGKCSSGPPRRVTSSAVSSIVSGRLYSDLADRVVRPVQTTVAPASPSAAAMPRPTPRVAPATTAMRPRNVFGFGVHSTVRVYFFLGRKCASYLRRAARQ